jgi:ribonuclease P protein component
MAEGNVSQESSDKLKSLRPAKASRKQYRLLRHADFERVYKQGKRHFAASMTVFYLKREENSHARVGYTVSRVLGGAVERNRMRRRLHEAVRLCGLPTAAVDIVVNPKKSLLTADFGDIRAQVDRAMQVIRKAVQ